jgi:hypothetical protein
MGYCMNMRDKVFNIDNHDKSAALQAVQVLAGKETITDGSGAHYSWVNTNEFTEATSLKEAMCAWRWELHEDEEGNVIDIDFIGEKLGDDTVLLEAIAPFVKEDSFIEMTGEDGGIWRWCFENKKMVEKDAQITWN